MIVQVRSRIALKGDESTALGLIFSIESAPDQQQQPVESATDRFQPRVALHPARLGKSYLYVSS